MGLAEIKCNEFFKSGSMRLAYFNFILVYTQIDSKKLFSLHVICVRCDCILFNGGFPV
jgi:hypothetical protein